MRFDKNFFSSFYYRLKKDSFLRIFIYRIFFHFNKLLNFVLNLLPFMFLKKIILICLGVKYGRCLLINGKVNILWFNNLTIGDNVTINNDVIIDNRGVIIIGDNVSIANRSQLITCSHDIYSKYFEMLKGSLRIGNNVCIFSSSMIMPNIIIESDCVIYPNSTVTKSTKKFGIYAGSPAKFIKNREYIK
jgi:putative colanic acid biosynthesis acetyltransferase WcaF